MPLITARLTANAPDYWQMVQPWEHRWTDGRTDRRYQTYYLPCFAVDNYSDTKYNYPCLMWERDNQNTYWHIQQNSKKLKNQIWSILYLIGREWGWGVELLNFVEFFSFFTHILYILYTRYMWRKKNFNKIQRIWPPSHPFTSHVYQIYVKK